MTEQADRIAGCLQRGETIEMKKSAKNYICILLMVASLYFTGVSIVRGHEVKRLEEEAAMKEDVPVSAVWYTLAAAGGLVFGLSAAWMAASRGNTQSPVKTSRSRNGAAMLAAGGVGGALLGFGLSSVLIGSLPDFDFSGRSDSRKLASAAVLESSTEQGQESEQTDAQSQPEDKTPEITADTFPVIDASQVADSIKAQKTITGEEQTYDDMDCTLADTSDLLIESGGNLSLISALIDKSGDSSDTMLSQDYGLNAAIFMKSGSMLRMNGGLIRTDGQGADALAICGAGHAVLDNVQIAAANAFSSALYASNGGTIEANNLQASTGQNSSPLVSLKPDTALTMQGGTLKSSGANSSALQGYGKFVLNNVTMDTSSPAVYLGSGSDTAFAGCVISSEGNTDDDSAGAVFQLDQIAGGLYTPTKDPIRLAISDSNITLKDGQKSKTAPLFRLNSSSVISTLKSSQLKLPSNMLADLKNADFNLSLDAQKATGLITMDDKSRLDLRMSNGSAYTGSINPANSDGHSIVHMDENSTWILSADSYITSLDNPVKDNANIQLNGHKLFVNGKQVSASKQNAATNQQSQSYDQQIIDQQLIDQQYMQTIPDDQTMVPVDPNLAQNPAPDQAYPPVDPNAAASLPIYYDPYTGYYYNAYGYINPETGLNYGAVQ